MVQKSETTTQHAWNLVNNWDIYHINWWVCQISEPSTVPWTSNARALPWWIWLHIKVSQKILLTEIWLSLLPRLATKILRGHDDLLSVFRRKFAPVDSGMMKKEIKDCCECSAFFSWQGWQGTGRIRLRWMLTHFAFELRWGLLILGKKHIGIMVELRKGTIPWSSFSTICFFVHLIESIASNASCRRLVGLFHSKSQMGFDWVDGTELGGSLDRPPRSKFKKKKVPGLQRFHHRKLTWHNQWALQVTLGKFWTGRFLDWRLGYFRKSNLLQRLGCLQINDPQK